MRKGEPAYGLFESTVHIIAAGWLEGTTSKSF